MRMALKEDLMSVWSTFHRFILMLKFVWIVEQLMNLRFEISIMPKAQKRARSRIVKTKDGRVINKVYKNSGQATEEDNFRALLYQHAPDTPHAGPIWLQIVVAFPVPKSKSKKWKDQARFGYIRHTTKADADNLAKHLKDCMRGIFYLDDKQIYRLEITKRYSDTPGWAIFINGD